MSLAPSISIPDPETVALVKAHLKRLEDAKKRRAAEYVDDDLSSTAGTGKCIIYILVNNTTYYYFIGQALFGQKGSNSTHRRDKSASLVNEFEAADQEEIDDEPDLGDVGDFEYGGTDTMNLKLRDEAGDGEDDPNSPNEDGDEDGINPSRETASFIRSKTFL